MSSGTVQSQDTYVAPGIALSVVGGGGSVPQNLQVSSISAPDLLNVSSINGVAYAGAGGVPANLTVSSISTLALNSISSINGVAYTGAGGSVPANLGVSSLIVNAGDVTVLNNAGAPTQGRAILDGTSAGFALTGFNDANAQTAFIQSAEVGGAQQIIISVGSSANSRITIDQNVGTTISTLTVSSINGINGDDIPFLYEQPNGLVDSIISSIYLTSTGNTSVIITECGAKLTGNISTLDQHKYLVTGCMAVSTVSGSFPAGTPNAYLSVWGGGGAGQGWVNTATYSYPQISTFAFMSGVGRANLQWSAPGGFSPINQVGIPNSTISYWAYCSPDWPVPIAVSVSTLVGTVTVNDLATVSILDFGRMNVAPI